MRDKDFTGQLSKLFLNKFLVNFVPGLILFYVLILFIPFATGGELLSFLIVTSVSWILGLLQEYIFFRKVFMSRWKENSLDKMDHIMLMFGKTGIAIVIACVARIDLKWILDLFDRRNEEEMVLINGIVKIVLCFFSGLLLYRMYKVSVRNKRRE